MTSPFLPGSLRELIQSHFERLHDQLKAIREVIETMPEKPIRAWEFEQLKLQVGSLSEGLKELEDRIIRLENHKSIANLIFRQALTIAVGLLIAYLLWVTR